VLFKETTILCLCFATYSQVKINYS